MMSNWHYLRLIQIKRVNIINIRINTKRKLLMITKGYNTIYKYI